jgi:hypothetical protein
MLCLESTNSELASCFIPFTLITIKILKFFQFNYLGFLDLIFIVHLHCKNFPQVSLLFQNVLNGLGLSSLRFMIFALKYNSCTLFLMGKTIVKGATQVSGHSLNLHFCMFERWQGSIHYIMTHSKCNHSWSLELVFNWTWFGLDLHYFFGVVHNLHRYYEYCIFWLDLLFTNTPLIYYKLNIIYRCIKYNTNCHSC